MNLLAMIDGVEHYLHAKPNATNAVRHDALAARTCDRAIIESPELTALCLEHGALIPDLFITCWEAHPQLRSPLEVAPDYLPHFQAVEAAIPFAVKLVHYDAYVATVATIAIVATLDHPGLTAAAQALAAAVADEDGPRFIETLSGLGVDALDIHEAVTTATDQLHTEASHARDWGVEPAQLQRMPFTAREALARRLSSPRLRELAELVGRMNVYADGLGARSTESGCGELVEVDFTAEVEQACPIDLAMLCAPSPSVRLLGTLSLAEGRLRRTVRESPEPVALGEMVVLVDSSGSMTSDHQGFTREAWAKAVALALLAHCPDRSVTLALFSSNGAIRSWCFPGSHPRDSLEFAETSLGGGTDIIGALHWGANQLSEHGDLVLITDGEAQQSHAVLREYLYLKTCQNFLTWGVFVSIKPGPVMEETCDRILAIEDLHHSADQAGGLVVAGVLQHAQSPRAPRGATQWA